MNTVKTTDNFSRPLFKQDLKSNWILILVILVIMVMMCNVVNFAMSMMSKEEITEEMTEAQETLYMHLFVMADANDMMQTDEYSLENFMDGKNTGAYEIIFENASKASGEDFSAETLKDALTVLKTSPVDIDTYVENFEYVYALAKTEGVFSGEELTLDEMMTNMLRISGMNSRLLENMAEMDTSSLLNEMYFHVIGLLPIFLLAVIIGNGLIVGQVDRGSLAYTLSTPTRRRAVAVTQAVFLILVPLILCFLVCLARIATTKLFFDEVVPERILVQYAGMYLLVEAVCGLCYLGSCFANRSRYALAFGGGLAVWFFLASLLGVFGSENLVNMGVGVEALGVFNKATIVPLFDINSIGTIGTGSTNYAFLPKFAILAAIGTISYIAGAVKFCKKDLPL